MSTSECPICYENITSSTGLTTLSCSHSFHFGCISGWFLNQEVGTCPCCRKEMTTTEDLPRDADEAESDDDSDDSDESDDAYEGEMEVSFNREKLGEFLKERGGVGMLETISAFWADATTVTFTRNQLHFLFIGNGAKVLTDEEWEAIIEDDEDDDLEEGEIEEIQYTNFTITAYDANGTWERHVSEEANKAATKLQAAWRGYKARETVMEKRVIHTLVSLKKRRQELFNSYEENISSTRENNMRIESR